MVIGQGDVCWASLDDPVGSSPGFCRPVVVVANVSQILTVDRSQLDERAGHLGESDLGLVLAGIDLVLGRK